MINEILIVDDEDRIRRLFKLYLEREFFEIYEVRDGKEVYEFVFENNYVCIFLDLMFFEMDGIEVVFKFREYKDIFIIMFIVKGEEINCVEGFELGVDDYIVKFFLFREVVLRVKVLLRCI